MNIVAIGSSSPIFSKCQMNNSIAQSVFVLLFWVAFLLLPGMTVEHLAVEDGPIENLGAAAFLVAAWLFFVSFLRSQGAGNDFHLFRTKRNLFLLLLAVAFVFAGGEEISWGQRIFGWNTPTAIADINAQDETTIHNLDIFQQGKSFSFWFNAFWIGFCVCVPLLDRWQPAHTLFERIRLPIVPLWTGVLLLVNYAAFKMVASSHASGSELRHAANELKESTIAVIFVWIAWILFKKEKAAKRAR
jgi:hypothetical protein